MLLVGSNLTLLDLLLALFLLSEAKALWIRGFPETEAQTRDATSTNFFWLDNLLNNINNITLQLLPTS